MEQVCKMRLVGRNQVYSKADLATSSETPTTLSFGRKKPARTKHLSWAYYLTLKKIKCCFPLALDKVSCYNKLSLCVFP